MLVVVLLSLLASAWGAEICCSYGGCFSDDAPYSHLPLPDCPSDINPVFWLYTRSNRNLQAILTMDNIPSVFSGSRQTVFIVHGYTESENAGWMHDMKDALLDKDDLNVVILGWPGGSQELFYPKAASNTRAVGAEAGLVIDNLKANGGLTSARVYCVGHSLGGHLCGHMGRATSIGRITGMDPAGPMYDSYPIEASLNPSCASFVDVIHTHGRGGPLMNYGTLRVLGDLDFYPNSGGLQPGCSTKEEVGQHSRHRRQLDVACSHSRAYLFFTESVKSDCFIARDRCTDNENIPGSCSSCGGQCAIMGYSARGSGSNGLYYLTTTDSAPFCEG